MASYYLMMDVGGTGIKAGILDRSGCLVGDIISFDARAKESKAVVLDNFAVIIDGFLEGLPQDQDKIVGIGMAFPGPFDYEQGISLMKGLDKYDSIYGCDIRQELLLRIRSKNRLEGGITCPFRFLHDVEAFALGESRFGQAVSCQKILCLCIGTGAGSAFLDKGIVIKQREDVPDQGWIYKVPFEDGMIDDYLSVRGLKKLIERRMFPSKDIDGVALYRLAISGNKDALATWEAFGTVVLRALSVFLQTFQPDGLILGGQISKSFPFFGGEISRYCKEKNITLYLTTDTSRRVLEGLYVLYNNSN